MADILYTYKNQVYANITNRCDCSCQFCIRSHQDKVGEAENLWFTKEPDLEEIKAAMDAFDFTGYDELVYCGYGEPTCALENLLASAAYIKEKYSDIKIRLNTNGHANRIAGEDITPQLEGLIDCISISLNAENAQKYNEICVCDYGEDGFFEMLDFAKKASRYVPEVVLSIVDVIGAEEIENCRKIAEETGVSFRVRQYSE